MKIVCFLTIFIIFCHNTEHVALCYWKQRYLFKRKWCSACMIIACCVIRLIYDSTTTSKSSLQNVFLFIYNMFSYLYYAYVCKKVHTRSGKESLEKYKGGMAGIRSSLNNQESWFSTKKSSWKNINIKLQILINTRYILTVFACIICRLYGKISTTTCLDSSFWCLSYWWLLVVKLQLLWFIFNCVLR